MALAKVSRSTAEQILALAKQGIDMPEIARLLNLKKMQVSAIIAHSRRQEIAAHSEEVSAVSEKDLPQTDLDSVTDEGLPFANGEDAQTRQDPISEEVEPEEPIDGIYVGDDREYEDRIYWTPTDPQAVQNPHLMIMGESGSGKTYAAQCLIAELSRRDVPSIVFDYGQSFELQALEPVFRKFAPPCEYLIGEEGLVLNPMQIFPTDLHGPHSAASRVSDVFDAVYQLGPIQRKVLIDAILGAFERQGIHMTERSSWANPAPTLSRLQEVLEEFCVKKDYPNYKNAYRCCRTAYHFFHA